MPSGRSAGELLRWVTREAEEAPFGEVCLELIVVWLFRAFSIVSELY